MNIGHGHVRARDDGLKARCGGPQMCAECKRELAATVAAAGDLLLRLKGAGAAEQLTPAWPRYRSHKIVEALKITRVDTWTLYFDGFPPIADPRLFVRHKPVPGDYLVRYADGYMSVSPAKAFEDGYTPA